MHPAIGLKTEDARQALAKDGPPSRMTQAIVPPWVRTILDARQ